uniref:hypothetical protein n=1 Tax=Marinobacterium profundum TaxID=1714300 RepID=UPI00083571AC|nr:hypothetical protein [Marinobacterium profundum]
MGMGSILLVVLGVAGFFLVRKFGVLGFILTLGNPSRSRFRRSQSDGQTIFNVTPARPSFAALPLILVGVVMLLNVETLGGVAYFGWLPVIMGVITLLTGARYRRAATITLVENAVHSGGKTWLFDEIVDFYVRQGSRTNADESAPVPIPTSTAIMRALTRSMVERSYFVSLRVRADSDEAVLSGGLTLECAEALQYDLREALSTSAKVSIGRVI